MENKLKSPIFITNNIGLEKECFIGGIFNDGSFWGGKTAEILLRILKNQKPQNIAPSIFYDDECQIAWKVFNHYRLDEDCLPAKTVFFNKPESFFRTYEYYIIGAVIVMTIFLLFYLYTLRSNIKLQNTQKLLLNSIDQTKEANKELEKAHEKLIEALHKAEESDRLKSAFLANMSHEIRTPLNAIVGFSSLISEAESDEDKMEYANLIQRNSDLLLQLISDILDISKIEAGELSLFYENVNVKDLCLNVISSLKTKCKPNVSLSLNDSSEITIINTDKNRLMQVIINFMNNAIKFTNKGHIELGYFSYSNDIIEFYVKDTGIGISHENLPTIFNRFIKLNSFYEGTGLGLPICKTVIEMMGGIIGVESAINAGSRFWFRLAKNGGKISDLD